MEKEIKEICLYMVVAFGAIIYLLSQFISESFVSAIIAIIMAGMLAIIAILERKEHLSSIQRFIPIGLCLIYIAAVTLFIGGYD